MEPGCLNELIEAIPKPSESVLPSAKGSAMAHSASAQRVLDSILHDQYGIVWDADSPEVWRELCTAAPRTEDGEAVITSSAGVDFALHEPGIFSSGPEGSFLGSDTGLIPLQIDPPEHARYRKVLDPVFSPKRVGVLEAGLRELMNTCIDAFIDRGWCDFGPEVATPFPIGTFLNLLGLPQSGVSEFIRLKEGIIRPQADSVEASLEIRRRTGEEISALFQAALTERETAPQDDLLTYFVECERAGEFPRADSINICHQLLIAGLDTVSGTMECAFGVLAERPDLQKVLTDPATIKDGVEELLRWIVTSPMQTRRAIQDVVVDGVAIPAGTHVSVMQATWNFDPDRFPDPLTIDLSRGSNRHATFGIGTHRCLGSHLARLELRVALEVWHQRIPSYRLPDGYSIRYSPSLRGIPDLRIDF
jgi:cytochrome P450